MSNPMRIISKLAARWREPFLNLLCELFFAPPAVLGPEWYEAQRSKALEADGSILLKGRFLYRGESRLTTSGFKPVMRYVYPVIE